MKNKLTKLIILILTVFLFFSCSKGKIGFAVILWSDNPYTTETGSLIPIYGESSIRNTYTIRNKNTKKYTEINKFRASSFKKKKEAQKYQNEYKQYIDTYAVVEKTGLPIREFPQNNSKRMYKLRNQQIIKIISKSKEMVNISELENYWYEVLTEDGILGYCFGNSLKIFNSTTDDISKLSIEETDDTLKNILSKEWRPYYYRNMMRTGRIVLPQFRNDYILKFNTEEKLLTFNLPGKKETFQYNEIKAIKKGKYLFEGPRLRLYVKSENNIMINYFDDSREITEDFIFIEENIEELIEKEKEKIKSKYEEIKKIGNKLSSSAYGKISLNDNLRFSWDNYQRLVPELIKPGFGKNGNIEFSSFLTRALKKEYDGVISFRFRNAKTSDSVSFLYNIESNGIKLNFVPKRYINNNLIKEKPKSSMVLFFTGREN